MENSKRNLVVAARPGDETLGFSSVCKDAVVVVVGDAGRTPQEPLIEQKLEQAAARLEAHQSIYLDHFFDTISDPMYESLVQQLTAMEGCTSVYTHSPVNSDPFPTLVALACGQAFQNIWVHADAGPAVRANVLSPQDFSRKMQIMNEVYPEKIVSRDGELVLPVRSVLSVEAFMPANFSQVMQSAALSLDEVLPFSDPWGFRSSAYEVERYDLTGTLLAAHVPVAKLRTIVEAGACEGAMTKKLRTVFPAAHIRAIEPFPPFADRLRENFVNDPKVEVDQRSFLESSLEADLILMCEVLDYAGGQLDQLIRKMRASYLMTHSQSYFDRRISAVLEQSGWKSKASQAVPCRFEPVGSEANGLWSRREGSIVRLFMHV